VAKKLNRKELRQPDQFLGFWARVSAGIVDFAGRQRRALVIGATAAITVIVGSIAMTQITESRAVRASEALDKVRKIATADLLLPGTPPKNDGVTHYATEKERLEAALASLDAYFTSPRGPLAAEAQLVRAGLLLDLGRAQEAADIYSQKLLGGKLDKRLAFLAREGLGYAYEQLGKLEEAKATFAKLGEGGDAGEGFYKDRALYHQARLAERGGNPTEAARIYKEVLDKNPTTSLRDEITNRLAVLDLK
jgi:tetratricopeptide (TPR) repeat protein